MTETKNGLPVVRPTRINTLNGGFTEVVIQCPFCGHEHRHMGQNLPGVRVSHCADMNMSAPYWVESS